MLLFVTGAVYLGLLYFKIVKPLFGKTIKRVVFDPVGRAFKSIVKHL